MKKQSAGILVYKIKEFLEILLVHPGGPFWKNKDEGAWTIPKGLLEENEDSFETAKREFEEETGISISGNFIPLEPIKQNSGKIVHAWAIEKNINVNEIKSNLFDLEWPPKSLKIQQFPEIDKGEWFYVPTAKVKINEGQYKLIEQLIHILNLPESKLGQPEDYHFAQNNQLNLFD